MLRRTERFGRAVSCFLTFFLTATPSSGYVLPYPSFMPGHKLYRIEEVFDRVYGWWCFGSLAQFKCNLSRADKKLVEVKVLFEYSQLSLGVRAVRKYRAYLGKAIIALEKAADGGKDISQKREIFRAALEKHREVLETLLETSPETFFWQEEKQKGESLGIKQELDLAHTEAFSFSQRLEKL